MPTGMTARRLLRAQALSSTDSDRAMPRSSPAAPRSSTHQLAAIVEAAGLLLAQHGRAGLDHEAHVAERRGDAVAARSTTWLTL
ncbi:MAG: hypothetical protein U1F43_25635 [Myxococcota bacterium]